MTSETGKEQDAYAAAGVNIDAGNEFVQRIETIVAATFNNDVLTGLGGFSAIIDLGFMDLALVASTDGVGTKLLIADKCKEHDTVGIDLVAMCANDIVVGGAKPLFFLDYFATGKLDISQGVDIIRGIARGCKIAGCSLVGGETAEMPGLYKPGDYDLAGFVVGIIDKKKIIDGSDIKVGDKIIGLASSGLHSNGFSLVRKICFEQLGLTVNDYVDELGCLLGRELLRPTRIYVKPVLSLIEKVPVKGMAHITGGGFTDNIPRVLPDGVKAVIRSGSWEIPTIFQFLKNAGGLSIPEMRRTFNCGVGYVVIVPAEYVVRTMDIFQKAGEVPYIIGEIAERSESEPSIIFA